MCSRKTWVPCIYIIKDGLANLVMFFSVGGSEVADSEVYEIDYRGPETHSSVMPPPGHFHGRPWIHQDTVKTSHKPQGFRGGNNGEQVRSSTN
jgi:hypothetical protein